MPGGGTAPAPSAHTCRVCSTRIMRLQDELVTLRLECTNLYRKGHFSTLELAPASTLSTTQVKGEPLTKGLHTSSASWFRKPMTRTELVAISSSEDEGSLRFVYELLAWVEEMQVRAASASLDQAAGGLVVLFFLPLSANSNCFDGSEFLESANAFVLSLASRDPILQQILSRKSFKAACKSVVMQSVLRSSVGLGPSAKTGGVFVASSAT